MSTEPPVILCGERERESDRERERTCCNNLPWQPRVHHQGQLPSSAPMVKSTPRITSQLHPHVKTGGNTHTKNTHTHTLIRTYTALPSWTFRRLLGKHITQTVSCFHCGFRSVPFSSFLPRRCVSLSGEKVNVLPLSAAQAPGLVVPLLRGGGSCAVVFFVSGRFFAELLVELK